MEVGRGQPERRRRLAVLGHRDFALLWSGQGVSQLGDGIFAVGLVLETLRVDNRPTALASVLAARTIPAVVLLLLGGAVVDRVPRRTAMLVSDVVRGLAVGALAVLVASGTARLDDLLVVSVVFGTAGAFFGPASVAIIPEIVPEDLLVQGNALSATTTEIALSLLGPSVGGLLVGVIGRASSFALDAASFAVSIVCLILMSRRDAPEASGEPIWRDAAAGITFIFRRPWLVLTIAAAALANLFGVAPLAVLIPLYVRDTLHGTALQLGLVLGAGGAGGLIASLAAANLPAPRRRIARMWTVYGVAGLAVAAMSLAPNLWAVGGLDAAAFGFMVYGDVLFLTMIQALIPKEMLGRTFSVMQLLAYGFTPVGVLGAGVLAASVGPRDCLGLAGILLAAPALVVLVPSAREPDRARRRHFRAATRRS